MHGFTRSALFLLTGVAFLALCGPAAAAEPKQLASPEMGVVVSVPDGWKLGDAKAPPTAVSDDGTVKLVVLYFEKLYLFEVVNSEKVAANFTPALKDAKVTTGEKAVVNGLVGEKVSGTGTLDGKAAQFNCVLVGDNDNKPNTLAVIAVGSEEAMKKHAKEIAAALESVHAKDAKEK